MIFVDASALVAILSDEPDRVSLSQAIAGNADVLISAVVWYEAATALARIYECSLSVAEEYVQKFVDDTRAGVVAVDADIGRLALEAFARFGKGRHPAGLNMGDCFSYACARSRGARLLFKGADFLKTDIEAA
jgi:ribonuclease VapC